MNELINFFINTGKLKRKKRREWETHQINDSESVASHSFRTAILSWILAEKQRINVCRVIKMALLHELCSVFAEDETPYDPFLLKRGGRAQNQEEIEKILRKWPGLSMDQKKQKKESKFEKEYQSFLRLIEKLPSNLKWEMESLFLEREQELSVEGRFAKQVNKAENFLQALEYWQEQGKIQKDLWVRWAKEIFDIPIIIDFVKAVEESFLKRDVFKRVGRGVERRVGRREEMGRVLDFLIEVGKFKRLKRKGWVLRRVKNPEDVASHTFRLSIETWILGREKGMDVEKLLKMALVHDLCELYAGSITPYDHFWPKHEKDQQELLKTWPRFSKNKEREKILKKRKKECAGLQRIVSILPGKMKREITELWLEFDNGAGREARFLKQLHKAENLLQAFEYLQEDRNFPIKPWWMEAQEKIDEPLLLKFVHGVGDRFSEDI